MNEKEFNQNTPDKYASSAENQKTEQGSDNNKAAGPIIGTIIIVVVLALGGLYFWGQRIAERGLGDTPPEAEAILQAPDETLEALGEQGVSDEIEDIEADLNATILEELDAELENIDIELNF